MVISLQIYSSWWHRFHKKQNKNICHKTIVERPLVGKNLIFQHEMLGFAEKTYKHEKCCCEVIGR